MEIKIAQQVYYEKLNRRLILLYLFERWNPIALGCHKDDGIHDCPLCEKYLNNECINCPIREKTKQEYCKGTPYVRFVNALPSEKYTFIEEETEFLISLLDKKIQDNLENIFIEWCKSGFIS